MQKNTKLKEKLEEIKIHYINYIQDTPFLIGLTKYLINLKHNKLLPYFIIIEFISGLVIYFMKEADPTIMRGGFPTILAGIIAVDIAIIAIWLPIILSYKQKEFDNHFIIKDFSLESNTVSKAIIDLFGLNNLYYNFIFSLGIFLIILFLGMVTVDKVVLFILFTAMLLFSIVTLGQIIALSNLVKNLEPNNISTLILKKLKTDVKILNKLEGHKDSSITFNICLEYTDLLVSHFLAETFRNKEISPDLKIQNIIYLLSELLYIYQKVSEILLNNNLIHNKYVWLKTDILQADHIIKGKLQNQTINFPNVIKLMNTIYNNSEYTSKLIQKLALYPPCNIKLNEFPLIPFVINMINGNEYLIIELRAEMIGKEIHLDCYKKLIMQKSIKDN